MTILKLLCFAVLVEQDLRIHYLEILKSSFSQQLVLTPPNRNNIYYAQTPQAFDFNIIYTAHKKFEDELEKYTDDAGLVEKSGQNVYVVEGHYSNKKITVKEDIL